ncbi:MAG: Fur family transcriptional regulator [Elusimicrobiota bacterium]
MTKEELGLSEFIKQRGLRMTGQRKEILEYLFNCREHMSPEDLYIKLRAKYPKIGRATVYRTMKLLKDADLAVQVEFADGSKKFEHVHNKPHHDHMICLKCGTSIEFCSPKIEELQEEMARKEGFTAKKHRLELYGYCRKCSHKIRVKGPGSRVQD